MGINTRVYIETYLRIKDKKAKTVPLVMNTSQKKLYDALANQHRAGKPQRVIILKSRQMGFSTITEGIIFKRTATKPNINSGIVAHEIQATNNLFRMSKRFYDNLPQWLRPEIKASNSKELIFDNNAGTGLGSSIKCMTAGNSSIGRSDTFQNLHISEYAFWQGNKQETLTGLLQSVPDEPNTMICIESTANGYDDFKDMWDQSVAGKNDFTPVFCAWWEAEEYRREYTGFRLTAAEKEIKALYKLDFEQMAWRRWCLQNNCSNNLDKFKQEYPSCPEEAFLMSGRPVFDANKVIQHITKLEQQYKDKPHSQGHFSYEWNDPEVKDFIKDDSIKWIEDTTKGYIRLYEPPRACYPYVIGGDTKGEGRDWFAGTVINNNTGRRVASLHMDVAESKPYTYQMYCLGRYYNDALIGIEINFNTAPIEELQRLRYTRQYVRQKYDDMTKQYEKKFGFKTDGNTRPLIIDKAVGVIADSIDSYTDVETLREALTFAYDKNGRPDAMAGKHDDLLMSDMIANEIRGQQRYDVDLPQEMKHTILDDFDLSRYKKTTIGGGDKELII